MIKIKSDKIILGESLFDGYLYADNGKIVEVSKEDKVANGETYDYTGKFVSAGFIDTHTHGAGGFPFMKNTVDDVINGCNFHLKFGMTTILPTISAAEIDEMEKAVVNIGKAKRSGKVKCNLLGAHMEGPYLSKEQCGAQCPTFITPPDEKAYKAVVERNAGDIIRWTFAPEHDEGGKFCKFLSDNGIIASAGHSNAKYSDMKVAIDNGCNLITHLYSCTSTVTRDHGFRSLGVIESAYLRDELYVELIADGKHLPSDLIKMILKIKGTDKVIVCTDSMDIAGTDVTEGIMGATEYIVEDGVCKLKDRSAFAGSVATADRLIKTLVCECDVPVPTAVKMLTEIPAKLLNMQDKIGSLEKGKNADIVVFDDAIAINAVFVGGQKI